MHLSVAAANELRSLFVLGPGISCVSAAYQRGWQRGGWAREGGWSTGAWDTALCSHRLCAGLESKSGAVFLLAMRLVWARSDAQAGHAHEVARACNMPDMCTCTHGEVKAAALHNNTAGGDSFQLEWVLAAALTCSSPCTEAYTPCRAAYLFLHTAPAAFLDLLTPTFLLSVCLAWMAGKHSLLHCLQTSWPEAHAAKQVLAGVRICALSVCSCCRHAERLQPIINSCTGSR
jgi:hypothetical protein